MSNVISIFNGCVGTDKSSIINTGISFRDIAVVLHENYDLGTPPAAQILNSPIHTEGQPSYYSILGSQGIKANGMIILLEYAGGPQGYFNQIAKTVIHTAITSKISNPAEFTGVVMINIEDVLPAMSENTTDLCSAGYIFMPWAASKGIPRNMAISLYNGMAAQYFSLVIGYIKQLCPKAKICWWGIPYSWPFWHWTNPVKVASFADTIAQLAWMWNLVDVIAPEIYCVFDAEEKPVGNGEISYNDWLNVRKSFWDQCLSLRDRIGKPIYPVLDPMYGVGTPKVDQPLEIDDIEKIVMPTLSTLRADGIIIWANAIPQNVKNIIIGLQKLSPYLESFRRGMFSQKNYSSSGTSLRT